MYFDTELSLSRRRCQKEGLGFLLVLRLMVLVSPSTGSGAWRILQSDQQGDAAESTLIGESLVSFSLDSCMDH